MKLHFLRFAQNKAVFVSVYLTKAHKVRNANKLEIDKKLSIVNRIYLVIFAVPRAYYILVFIYAQKSNNYANAIYLYNSYIFALIV